MSITLVSASVSQSPTRQHQSKRLRSFALPDGREVHIALSPEEAESLRQKLQIIRKDEPFDLVISGSLEHLEALRRAHAHHEQRRQSIREKYAEAYDEFENIKESLDNLSTELHMLSTHAVSLDANFSKYGYDAQLRTYDEPSESTGSSLYKHDGSQHEEKDWDAERYNRRIFKLYKKPIVRQYFHRGLLWRASQATEVAAYELFVDLLYVGIIAINGDNAAESPTGEELQRFAITFIMSWRIWSDLSVLVSWFATDDLIQRLSVLYIMACLVGLTTNMLEVFDNTYSQLVAFFLAARLFGAVYYGVLSYLVPMVRAMMIGQMVIIIVPSLLWISSIHVAIPNRLILIWIAIALDYCGSMIIVFLVRGSSMISSRLATWANSSFEFYPAVNIEHKTARTDAFVTLIFGYSVIALLYQNSASFGVNAFFGKAILGLIQAFCLNALYFEIDGDSLWQHAIRRNVFSSSTLYLECALYLTKLTFFEKALCWLSAHLPFLLGYSLSAAALSRLVVAHDCQNATVEDLTESYVAKSEDEISNGLRWFYCGGLGVALLSMGLISLTHIHKEVGGIRIKKSHRLFNRLVVAIIITCLPLSYELNSLFIISTTTGLIVWVLLVELYGASCPSESFFGETRTCNYTARCRVRRADMEAAAKSGQVLKLQEISDKGEKGEKGLYEIS